MQFGYTVSQPIKHLGWKLFLNILVSWWNTNMHATVLRDGSNVRYESNALIDVLDEHKTKDNWCAITSSQSCCYHLVARDQTLWWRYIKGKKLLCDLRQFEIFRRGELSDSWCRAWPDSKLRNTKDTISIEVVRANPRVQDERDIWKRKIMFFWSFVVLGYMHVRHTRDLKTLIKF